MNSVLFGWNALEALTANCHMLLSINLYFLYILGLQAADMHSTSRVLVCIVQLCFKSKDWNALNEHIVILTKRRSQLKQVNN